MSTLPFSNLLRLLFRTLDSRQINRQLLYFWNKIFLEKWKAKIWDCFLFRLIFLPFPHFQFVKLGSSLLWDEKRDSPPFVHCELTAIINLKSKQDFSLIIHWIVIVGKLSFPNEKVKVLMKKANDERTKWKWKCFTVHCVTLGECLVSETSGAWTNHWSLVGLGRRGYWLCKWEKRE